MAEILAGQLSVSMDCDEEVRLALDGEPGKEVSMSATDVSSRARRAKAVGWVNLVMPRATRSVRGKRQ